ncbi:hypothetical protein BGZ65_011206, partial [Modicella reniformis]
MDGDDTALYANPVVENSTKEDGSGNHTAPSTTTTTTNTLFVTCSGMYIDVFKVTSEKWIHLHTFKLTSLVPMHSRRVTCKVMMEVISSKTFMWLEDNGICCTLWDLRKGSNISYIFSRDNAKFSDSNFRGSCKIAISLDESVVALPRDDTLTTYYANSGIEINTRRFLDHRIEYVTFHGQDNQLFVILRDSLHLNLCSLILDPLQLSSQIKANQVPIPIIGKTIFTFFNHGALKNKGLVCEARGSEIHCYVSHEPVENEVLINEENLVTIAGVYYPPQTKDENMEPNAGSKERPRAASEERPSGEAMEEHQRVLNVKPRGEELNENKLYEVKVESHKESFQDGDGSMYWVIRVEVVEKDSIQDLGKVVFSFVPEPWMRVSTTDVRQPDKLQSVYFLPR